jgi:hypothetical protein
MKTENHKIARLILTGKEHNKSKLLNINRLEKLLSVLITKAYQKQHFKFIQTPGGFLNFDFPEELQTKIDISKAELKVSLLQSEAEMEVASFFKILSENIYQKLREIADYITIGIDGTNSNGQIIELVAVYDLKKEKVVRWTGKFYPTVEQIAYTIKINDLNTHFIELNGDKVVILGCHDLNIFSPRGQANAGKNKSGWRYKTAQKFKKLCREFSPDIILQHPHTTDYSKIWNGAWNNLEKEFPNVKHFASGIKYFYPYGSPRGKMDEVLAKTKKGDVIDFYL